jgi:predicted GNAT superfamily acetyltransferase
VNRLAIRPAEEGDFPAVLALNEESVEVLAPLTRERLDRLHRTASLHWVIEDGDRVVGFVMAFREGIAHDSVNYLWFAERYPKFLYIDRVVVGAQYQGQGLGAQLYEDLFAFARAAGLQRVTCEYDVDPPNPGSARFHRRLGFIEVGRQQVAGGSKTVALLECQLTA